MATLPHSTQTQPLTPAPHSPLGSRHNPVIDLFLLALRPKLMSPASPTAAWISAHPMTALIGLAYGLTWIGLIPLIMNPHLPMDPGHVSPSALVMAFLGILGCLWAALIVASATGGAAGRSALLRSYLRWRVGWQWYLAALVSPALVWLAAVGLDYLVTGQFPALPAFGYLPVNLLSAYGVQIVFYMVGNYEEICWRASLLPRLQARHSALVAALLVGLVQGAWHLPYVFVAGSFVQAIGLPAMVRLSIALGVVATWAFNSTRGSLLIVALFHAAFGAWSSFQGSNITVAYLMIGVWCLVALIVLAIYGAQNLTRRSDLKIVKPLSSTDPA